MRRAIHILCSAFANLGMANGLYSLYHTNPPIEPPHMPTADEAAQSDAEAIRGVWCEVGDCLRTAMSAAAENRGPLSHPTAT